jgi:hypothetical protein
MMYKKISTLLFSAVFLSCGLAAAQNAATYGGEARAQAPTLKGPNHPGYFQLGVGPSFSAGLGENDPMYDLAGSYHYNLSDRVAAKVMGDLNFASGTTSSRFADLGVGGDVYLSEMKMGYGVPYATADVGYGSVRDAASRTAEGAAVGAGAGFKVETEALNLDINLHYAVLTEQLNNTNPSILGLRMALNF